MLSMIHPATLGAAAATKEIRMRNNNPSATTHGPESQTMRRTGGTFFSASRRSPQAEKKELRFCFAIVAGKVRSMEAAFKGGFYSRDARRKFCFFRGGKRCLDLVKDSLHVSAIAWIL